MQVELKNDTDLYLHGLSTDHIWLMEDGADSHPIGIRLDCGDSGTVYLSRSQAKDLAEQLLRFAATPASTARTDGPSELLEVLSAIESVSGDDFCADLDMRNANRKLHGALATAYEKLGQIYRLSHGFNTQNSCHHVHTNWREELKKFAAPGSVPPHTNEENYVAWCRYAHNAAGETNGIRLCDSDSPGAFKVYRHPGSVPQAGITTAGEMRARIAAATDEEMQPLRDALRIAVDHFGSDDSEQDTGVPQAEPPKEEKQ